MKTNKQIKQMIARATGGEWINNRLINKPELLFLATLPITQLFYTSVTTKQYQSKRAR